MVRHKGRGGQKRKSARILALEASKKAKTQTNSNNSTSSSSQQQQSQEITAAHRNATPPSTPGAEASPRPRKGRKKKRLDEVAFTSFVPTTQQNEEKPKHEVSPVKSGAPSVLPSAQKMPQKRVLEFILDILQRRDTHELFAQPVDRNEVVGYYSIVEKPMDFGTVRAKLQEGMYISLEQFERDVFLISSNAMLFNSSATIYFRQARAIHELAKRVFNTLKTDPHKLEIEFSPTRRRHGRKHQVETRGSRIKFGAKLRGNSLAYHGSSGSDPHDNEFLHGFRYGRRENFVETERRQTYNRQTILSKESIFSTVHTSSKQLVIGDRGLGYKESLQCFVKDLGPTAQKVANQRLRSLAQTSCRSVQDSGSLISLSAGQQQPSCLEGIVNVATGGASNPLGIQGTTSLGKNILTIDSIDIDSSAGRENMALGIGRLDIHGAVSKGKGVLFGDNLHCYGGAFLGALHKETLQPSGTAGTHGCLQGEMAHDPNRQANNRALNREMAAHTGPSRGVLPSNDQMDLLKQAVGIGRLNSAGTTGACLKYMELLQGPTQGDNIGRQVLKPNIFRTSGERTDSCSNYATKDRMVCSSPLGDQAQVTQLASRSPSDLLELSSSNWKPKSAVYPSKVIKASSSNQTSIVLHGLGNESNAPLHLFNSGASSAQMTQSLQWSRPTPWGPQAIYNFPSVQQQLGEQLNKDEFMRQEPQLMVHQFSHPKHSHVNPLTQDLFAQQQSQVAPVPYMQVQPGGVNPLDHNAVLQQQLRLALARNMQPQQPNDANTNALEASAQRGLPPVSYAQQQPSSLLNHLGQDVYGQAESHEANLQQLPLAQHMQPLPSIVILDRNVILSRGTQLGLPQQGLMSSDPGNFGDRAALQGCQQNINAQFWNLQQQALRSSQHPDLALGLRTQNRRL